VSSLPDTVWLTAPAHAVFGEILTLKAVKVLADLQRTYMVAPVRNLLAARVFRHADLDAGEKPDFLLN
jgi:hypothetical protein